MFGNPTLEAFAPDVVYVHTTFRNLAPYLPHPDDSAEAVEGRLVDAERPLFRDVGKAEHRIRLSDCAEQL